MSQPIKKNSRKRNQRKNQGRSQSKASPVVILLTAALLLIAHFSGVPVLDQIPALIESLNGGQVSGSLWDNEPGESWEADSGSVILFDDINIPAYVDSPVVEINQNIPFFTEEENTVVSFETYSLLDQLGRCGVAYANIGQDLMPSEDRESISKVKPTGWQTVKYDCVVGKYLYNRCHLIGFQLAGENANEQNLITGTRYLNVDGMLPYENMVADYVKKTGNHVLYRVTPVFEGDDLVARGVLIEAKSVEDEGAGICFNIYAYNVQPGVEIDYATGESKLAGKP